MAATIDDDDCVDVRRFRDPIHDYITITPKVCAFVDTPQFQRLRQIKQLAACYYVWPGASHNRFEHCLGVAHLARWMVEHLRTTQPGLDITDRDVHCVTIAGLCHDLGHGPWSHAWDGLFMPQAQPGSSWKHEQGSEMMFDYLIQDNDIDMPPEDITFVKALIRGSHDRCSNEKKFLFDIVSNERNGIDVDKFDYIQRDELMVNGGKVPLSRLIESARVINNEICYDIKDANLLYEMCHHRLSLHKLTYNHKTTRALEHMIIDALLAAEPHMQISAQVYSPERFLHLTDDLMTRIESSDTPELAPSRAIFKRIRQRDLYKTVDYKTFPWEHLELCKNQITPEAIVMAAKKASSVESNLKDVDISQLKPQHIIVDLCLLHHGKKDKNPIDFVKFYAKRKPNECYTPRPGDMSTLAPGKFAEVLLRVYTRELRFFGAIQAGYRAILECLLVEGTDNPVKALVRTGVSGTEETAILTPRPSMTPPPSTKSGFFSSRKRSYDNNSFTTVPFNYSPMKKPINKRRRVEES